MKLSYVITTRDNQAELLQTLNHLEQHTGLPEHEWEVLVVDNASSDGTGEMLAGSRRVHVICLAENEGVPARNLALAQARGKFIALIGDNVRPTHQAVPHALSYLGRHPKTAAVVGRVELPDGSAEAPALPSVLMGAASILRKSVLDQVGRFATEFFHQEAEYDLSFRMWGAGYRIERFEDLCFARGAGNMPGQSDLACRMDLRNNLILVERYLPRPLRRAYRHDWIHRYARLALRGGRKNSANAALKEARVWARRENVVGRRTLSRAAAESIFQIDSHRAAVGQWAQSNRIARVFIADWGKNLFAAWNACKTAGLKVEAIVENSAGLCGSSYRSIPVISEKQAEAMNVDGVILSNVNPSQVERRARELEQRFSKPVLRLWSPALLFPPSQPVRADPEAKAPRRVDEAA